MSASTILLISDDCDTDRQLRLVFHKSAPQMEFGVVRSRREIEESRTPNIILLDLMLANEPAFDILRWLRSRPPYRQIPVFAFGSEVLEHDVAEAYMLGANSCLRRDHDSKTLHQIARGLVSYAELVTA